MMENRSFAIHCVICLAFHVEAGFGMYLIASWREGMEKNKDIEVADINLGIDLY
jgi:hypothetical protein